MNPDCPLLHSGMRRSQPHLPHLLEQSAADHTGTVDVTVNMPLYSPSRSGENIISTVKQESGSSKTGKVGTCTRRKAGSLTDTSEIVTGTSPVLHTVFVIVESFVAPFFTLPKSITSFPSTAIAAPIPRTEILRIESLTALLRTTNVAVALPISVGKNRRSRSCASPGSMVKGV